MMEKKPEMKRDAELAVFFDAAKNTDVQPDGAFIEAVMAQAMNRMDAHVNVTQPPKPSSQWWSTFLRNIGGWQTVTALAVSAFMGVTAGYTTPGIFDNIGGTQTPAETNANDNFSVASDIEALFQEG